MEGPLRSAPGPGTRPPAGPQQQWVRQEGGPQRAGAEGRAPAGGGRGGGCSVNGSLV